jgi:Holliday junction DNA helicase RuvB
VRASAARGAPLLLRAMAPDPERRDAAASIFHAEEIAARLGPPELERLPEAEFENSLRPRRFEEFVGQRQAVDNLRVAIQAAKARGDSPDHVLLSGPPGLGKTSLAKLIALELGTTLHSTTGPALERARDLVGILTQLKRGDVLFIDEIHRVPPAVEEYLYSAMEDFAVDLTLDQGPNARVLPLKLERFVLAGATTREGLLSAPFRGRFGLLERLTPYPTEDLVAILDRSASILGLSIDRAAATVLAERSRGTPRVANRFLRRARDVAQLARAARIDREIALETMRRLGVDEHGLEDLDRRILACLARSGSRAVGLKTVAAAVGESEDTIQDVFEPHLLRCGFLDRTSRGRVITAAGCTAIGLDPSVLGDERNLFP